LKCLIRERVIIDLFQDKISLIKKATRFKLSKKYFIMAKLIEPGIVLEIAIFLLLLLQMDKLIS
jgi:hypothetical protein